MRAWRIAAVMAVVIAGPLEAQAPTRAQLDSVRTELVRARGFVRASETQFTKTLAMLDSLLARMGVVVPPAPVDTVAPPVPVDTTSPPPVVVPPPAPTDPTARIYAQHDFNDGSLGRFSTNATASGAPCNFNGVAGQCSSDIWVRNNRAEIRYERTDTITAGDRNRMIQWFPKDGTENTPFGATLYVAATWTIPSVTPAARAKIDSAAARWGKPAHTDTVQEVMQRKIIYGNNGRKNHFVLKIQSLNLQFLPGVGGGAPCSTNPAAAPRTLYRFKDSDLFDKPQRIELEIKRSSGVRVADAELRVWLNGVELPKQTGFCTNEDSSTSWMLSIGQQVSYTARTGEFYSELRVLDDVIVASKRPF